MIKIFTPSSFFSRQFIGTFKYNFIIIAALLVAQTVTAGNNMPGFATELSVSTAGHNLVISWQADKSTFNYYEVQRSVDGQQFETIGLVLDAPENSNLCMFKDKMPLNSKVKTIWYRIRAIDKDGTGSISNAASYSIETPVAVKCEAAVFPNPLNNSSVVNFKSSEAGFAQLTVQNLDGKILLSKQSHIIKGFNTIGLD